MTDETTYNGWTNYATWRINLEICDDLIAHLSNSIRDGDTEPFNDVAEMVDSLSEEVDNILTGYGALEDDTSAELALSYARTFVSDVNFWEIARTYENDPDYAHLFASEDDDDE